MRAFLRVLLVLSALAGCGDENRSQTAYTPSDDKSSTSANDTTIVPAPVVPGVRDTTPKPPPPRLTTALALGPLGGSLQGSAHLASAGTGTSASVALSGGQPGTTYAGAIREGRCARIGSDVASLNPVSADSAGRGAAATSISVPLDSLMRVPHVLVYGKGGRPQSCGEISTTGSRP